MQILLSSENYGKYMKKIRIKKRRKQQRKRKNDNFKKKTSLL